MRLIFLLGLFIFVIGCSSTPTPTQENYVKYLNTWLGQSESKLINEIGVPTSHYELGNKQYILYSRSNTVYLPGSNPSYYSYGSGYSHPIGGSTSKMLTFSCDTTFVVEGGIVSSWKIKGNGCKM